MNFDAAILRELATALAEKVIRDRFPGRKKRVLLQADIGEQVAASLIARLPPKLLDLCTSGASRLGVPPIQSTSMRSTLFDAN